MKHILIDTLLDSLKTLPFLFLVYLLIELIEHKAMDRLKAAIGSEKLGVVSGAALGLFPQCGFSAAAANLYAEGMITVGAMLAVFLATSDEAFPVLASHPEAAGWLLPLIAVKFVWAVIVGFAVNFVWKRLVNWHPAAASHPEAEEHHGHRHGHHHGEHIHEAGEHHHCSHCDSSGGIVKNALRRTFGVFVFLLITGFLLHLAVHAIGEENLAALLMTDSLLQPLLAALIGLIPNCAASMVLTELFLSGTLSFGSLTAGLSAGAGVGLLVLFNANRKVRQNLVILGILYLAAALIGLLLQILV